MSGIAKVVGHLCGAWTHGVEPRRSVDYAQETQVAPMVYGVKFDSRNIDVSSCQSTRRTAFAYAPVSSPRQPSGFRIRLVVAGCLVKSSAGRTGRRTSSPPQLGQTKLRRVWQHCRQNVHSNVHTYASSDSGGRSRSQHSHPGLSSKAIIAPWEPSFSDYSR